MAEKQFTFKVTLSELDPEVTESEVREYISDALSSWGGSLHPEDPMFGSGRIVEVKRYRESVVRTSARQVSTR